MFKEQLRSFLAGEIPEAELKTWFDPLVLTAAGNLRLRVEFPHFLFFEWFKANFKEKFEAALKNYKRDGLIPCYCRPPAHSTAGMFGPIESCGQANRTKRAENPATAQQWAGASGLEGGPGGLNGPGGVAGTVVPTATFENFLFNRKNEFPVAAAKNFAKLEGPGQLAFYSSPGCGKSHLLRAIFAETSTFVPENNIYFGTLDELETIIENNAKKGNPFFLPFYELRALILDNFQDCAGKDELQKNLVKLLELCAEQKIYIALALDSAPAQGVYLSSRLRSMLENGLVMELKKPDLAIKTRYVNDQNELLSLKLKKEEILYLARFYSEFRQLKGALLKISAFKRLRPGGDHFILANILKNSGRGGEAAPSPEKILACVAEYFNMTVEEIKGKGRSGQVVLARHISMYLLRELLPINFNLIGQLTGRDHSSVVYSVNKIKEIVKTNKETNKLVNNIKNMCLNGNRRGAIVT